MEGKQDKAAVVDTEAEKASSVVLAKLDGSTGVYAVPFDPLAQADRPKQAVPAYSVGEDIFSSILHGLAALLAIAGFIILVVRGAYSGEGIKLASALVFGLALFFVYLSSSLYHALQPRKAKLVFRTIRRACAYLLIAATYTPLALVILKDHYGFVICIVAWIIAAAGVVFEMIWIHKPRWITVFIYLVLGWLALIEAEAIYAGLSTAGFWLLLAGGIAYTCSGFLYLIKLKLQSGFVVQAISSLFVLAGSILHYFAILLYVIG